MSWLTEKQEEGLKLSFEIKKVLASKKSKFQKIDIVETNSHGLILALDEKIMLTERDEFIYHEMISHIPLFSAKNAKNVLIIGGGDGATARECLKHTYLKNVDVCEIDGDVVELCKKHMPSISKYLNDKKMRIFIEDGFKFLKDKKNQNKYDVIIIDSMDPIGIASVLIEDSFFSLVNGGLKKGGIVCIQTESPFFFSTSITRAKHGLSHFFKNVEFYTAPVPTYPSGYWSFAIASNNKLKFNQTLYKSVSKKFKSRFYNNRIHISCFALPNFFIELLKKSDRH